MLDFDIIYRLYFQDVYYFLLSLSKDKHVAEDLTSQTFFKALQNSSKIDESKSLKSYLFTIAKNLFIDYVRKNKNLVSSIEGLDFIDNESSIEEIILQDENISEVTRAIMLLDEPGQSIIKLRTYEDYSFEDIGKHFAKSSNWARVNYFRAKEKLRKILGDDYERM